MVAAWNSMMDPRMKKFRKRVVISKRALKWWKNLSQTRSLHLKWLINITWSIVRHLVRAIPLHLLSKAMRREEGARGWIFHTPQTTMRISFKLPHLNKRQCNKIQTLIIPHLRIQMYNLHLQKGMSSKRKRINRDKSKLRRKRKQLLRRMR